MAPPTRVLMVDGPLVRNHISTDFIGGTNEFADAWCPKGTIVLERGRSNQDLLAFLVHEIRERKEMATGKAYPEAHADATVTETRFRRATATDLLKAALERCSCV